VGALAVKGGHWGLEEVIENSRGHKEFRRPLGIGGGYWEVIGDCRRS